MEAIRVAAVLNDTYCELKKQVQGNLTWFYLSVAKDRFDVSLAGGKLMLYHYPSGAQMKRLMCRDVEDLKKRLSKLVLDL